MSERPVSYLVDSHDVLLMNYSTNHAQVWVRYTSYGVESDCVKRFELKRKEEGDIQQSLKVSESSLIFDAPPLSRGSTYRRSVKS